MQQERSLHHADMHDGIGVYLTSVCCGSWTLIRPIVSICAPAHNALNDLRLMIDSLGSTSNDLPAMLGMFRTWISPLVEACQVELEWEVAELPAPKISGRSGR
ncbi:MAG: hypothetical protein R3E95_23150 [Thiolinea sp.]